MQANAHKRKQNRFQLLPFISPNRDFSKGYGRRNKNNSARISGCVQSVSPDAPLLSPREAPAERGFDFV
jgi:hypothetical protein